jgi:hypothetical protein
MNRLLIATAVILIATAGPALAQQPAAPGPPRGGPHHGGGMMPMEMCRDMMMAGTSRPGMGHGMMHSGMMAGQAQMDPKTMAQMMEMRAEMMRAMSDIMLKHAEKMRQAQ